jgi:hypothetical protein
MKINLLPFFALVAALTVLPGITPAARAQATRTWVSGVGDDVNPGSRTAPCKTFAGAISKTAAGGEIDCLDSGGFGTVTITNSITIDGTPILAGVLASGTDGIIVNAGTNDVVTLRNISFNGIGSGLFGLDILSAGSVRLENCVIYGWSCGVFFIPANTNATLYLLNCHIHTCRGQGVIAETTGSTSPKVVIEHCQIERCSTGVACYGPVVTLSDSTVANNTSFGLTNSEGGTILTYHNNRIYGNNPDGNFSGSLPLR